VLEAGAPPLGAAKRSEDGSTLNAQPSTMPPRLAFSDPSRGIWLYHGNSLELLDAIAAKYPDGRFDAIFADPPYFLSNGGITCHAETETETGRFLILAHLVPCRSPHPHHCRQFATSSVFALLRRDKSAPSGDCREADSWC
jgi:16S rRNA G966 N2-methylase RsmD